jgi:hypothetical protein
MPDNMPLEQQKMAESGLLSPRIPAILLLGAHRI